MNERLKERFAIMVAWLLPRRIVMWCGYRVGAHATTGSYGNQIPGELTFMDAMRRWGRPDGGDSGGWGYLRRSFLRLRFPFLSLGRWNRTAGERFVRQRVWLRGYIWTPLVMVSRRYAPAVAALLLLAPAVALAQDAAVSADAPIGDFGQVALAILATAMTGLLAFLAWGARQLKKVIGENVENAWIVGALQRLTNEVYELASLVGTDAEHLIIAARAPGSPGGTAITGTELDNIGRGILASLAKRYGGWAQLFDTLKRIGLGEDEATAKNALLEQIKGAVAANTAKENPAPSPS